MAENLEFDEEIIFDEEKLKESLVNEEIRSFRDEYLLLHPYDRATFYEKVGPDLRQLMYQYLSPKELAEIFPEPDQPANTREVDKLVKAFWHDGKEAWMLLHLEVQGSYQKDFARRMFEYYTRLFSKYGRPIAAIAILTAKNGNGMVAHYEDLCLWTRINYEYKTLDIPGFPDQELEGSSNPFAAVILVAKEVLLKVKDADDESDNKLLEHKLKMVRLLKDKMAIYGERKTKAILVFLNNYVSFKNPEVNRKFMEQTDQIFGKENTMGIIEQLADIKHREGVEAGRKEGVEAGRKEGAEAGRKEAAEAGLVKAARLLLMHTEYSPDKIAQLVGVDLTVVEKEKRALAKK